MKVLIAIDDSVYSKEMLRSVCSRQWPQDVQFKILNVMEPLPALGHDAEELAIEIKHKRQNYAQKLCNEVRTYIENHVPSSKAHFEIREGKPSTEILLAATEWDASKILIGAHGHAVCPHNLLGSVSRSVVEKALCTVEIVRTGVRAPAGVNKLVTLA